MLAMASLSQAPSPRPREARLGLVFAIVCAGVVLASLDLFVVNLALPAMGRDFGIGPDHLGDLSWVLNAYAIVYAALLVLLGRIAERYPRERGFLAGVAIFTAASAACGAATSLPMLVAFRAVQAAGAALLTPTSLALILATFPAERRAGAVRSWTALGGVAAAIGPVIGGLLVAAGWRWVFFVNVPIGVVALVAGRRLLPRVAGHPVRPPDAIGALLVTGGVGALSLGVVEGGTWGWSSPGTVLALAAGACALCLFGVRCAWHANALVDPALFRRRSFTGAAAAAFLFSAAFAEMLLSRVLWTQDVWGWSPLLTGLALAPGPLMVPLVSFLVAGRLTRRLGARAVVAIGSGIYAAGAIWWGLAMGLRPDYVGELLGGMLLTGIGVGLTLPTLMATGAGSLPAHSFATGSAVINMVRQIGLAIGVAVLIAVLGTPHSPAETLLAYVRVSWVMAGTALACGAVGFWLLAPGRRVVEVGPA